MNLSEMKMNRQVVADEVRADPDFRAEWKRTAAARALALEIVGYRAEHDLSQRELATCVGLSEEHVAEAELGDALPAWGTMVGISSRLCIAHVEDQSGAKTRNDGD